MRKTLPTTYAFAIALLVASLPISGANSMPPLSVQFSQTDSRVVAVNPQGLRPNGTTLLTGTPPILLLFSCSVSIDCQKVTAALNGKTLQLSATPTAGAISLTAESGLVAGNNEFSLYYAGEQALKTTMLNTGETSSPSNPMGLNPDVTNPNAPTTFVNKTDLAERLQSLCPPRPVPSDHPASFVIVTPTGKLLSRNGEFPTEKNIPRPPVIDESQSLTVYVLLDSKLASFVNVRRKSAIRDRDTISILGGTAAAGSAASNAQNAPVCEYVRFDLQDFSPGSGQVEIDFPADGQLAAVGSFDFRVDRLYWGMLSFGVAVSHTSDKAFKLDTNNKIVSGETGDRVLYTLMLTPFVWEKGRDLWATSSPWSLKHFNPTFGIAANDLTNHALVGIAYDYSPVVLSAGFHFARVTGLASGIQEGSVYSGMAANIPTAKTWKHSAYISLGLDMRIAGQLIKALIGGGGGSGGANGPPPGGGSKGGGS